jgi:hypothetical protein
MNLEYKILWFDDSADFFESLDLEELTGTVAQWGFVLKLVPASTPEEFMSHQPFDKYDLIAVDFNLGDNRPHGEEFVAQVRQQSVFTEIVFYSSNAASDLWKGVHDRQLEGVFVANRQNILSKIERVAHQSLRKVLDLNHMRGMVMAEVGDLDRLLDSIIASGFPALEDAHRAEAFTRFQEEGIKQVDGQKEKLLEFGKSPTVAAMCDLSDSNKRWASFNRLKKRHAALRGLAIGDYVAQVLSPRNYLAHGTPSQTEEGPIFSFNGKTFLFNEASSRALRKLILDYKRQFNEVQATLDSALTKEASQAGR